MAAPVIHYTFDTDGTNSGTSGSTGDTNGTISTTIKFIGTGSLETTDETRSTIPKYNFTSVDTKGITFSFWLKHDGSVIDTTYYLYSCHPSSTTVTGGSWSQLDTLRYSYSASNPSLQLYTTNPLGFGSNSDTTTDKITSAEFDPLFDGNWHHVAVSYDPATLNDNNQRIRKTTVYIDNTIVCYADDWVGGFPDNQDNIVIIGETYMNSEGTYNKPWPGNYDDFRMYDYALTNSQITNVYKSGLINSGSNLLSLVDSGTLTIEDFVLHGYTVAQLLAEGFTQADIDIALTNIKIHSDFTISDGTSSSVFTTTDAVYSPTTFAAKLNTDFGYAVNTITAGVDDNTTDSTPYYRIYLQFANAVTLTGMPKYIFNIPFSDFSVKAGGQVNLRNVNLEHDMTIATSFSYVQSQIGEDIDGSDNSDESGFVISLSENGNIVAIGSYKHDGGKGVVRIFQRDTTNTTIAPIGWTQLGHDIDGETTGELFGAALALSADGTIVASAAYLNNSARGKLRVFQRDTTNTTIAPIGWTLLGSAIEGDNANEKFGTTVSLNADGTIVGWGSKHSSPHKVNVYQYANNTWTPIGTISGDGVQSSPHILNDAGTIVATSDRYWNGNVGRVSVHQYANDTWTPIGGLIEGVNSFGFFGQSIALNGDGTIMAIGCAKMTDGNTNGMVQVYQYANDTWTKIGNDINGEFAGDGLGYSVSLNTNGTRLAAGSINHDYAKGTTKLYQFANDVWTPFGNDIDGEDEGDELGYSLSLSRNGEKLAVGSRYHDNKKGTTKIYQLPRSASNTSTIPAGNHFINNFVSTIETDLANYTLSYDASNALITFDGLAQDISMSITSTDTTVFDTTITEITVAENTLPFLSYGQPDPTLQNYSDNGFTISEFVSNGYTIADLYKGGFVVDWNFDTDANHFDQSYIKGFTDVSGSVAIRNDNRLITNGDLSLGGNLTINPTPPIQPGPITTLIPDSDLTKSRETNGITYYQISDETPDEISGVSIDSLDQVGVASVAGMVFANEVATNLSIYKYVTDANGDAVTGNIWIIGSLHPTVSMTRGVMIEFTLNGTTLSVQQLAFSHTANSTQDSVLGNGDFTSTAADLSRIFNDTNVGTITTSGLAYSITGLSYTLPSAPIAQPQGSLSLVNNDMTLKSHLFMGEDISANGNVYIGGDLSVNGQFSGNFADGIIPLSAIASSSSGAIEISGNVLFAGDVSFNGPIVGVSNILQVNQLEFNDGTTMTTHDDNILSGTFAGANVIFKSSTFQDVSCNGDVSANATSTSSDYRIKENVTDLNETDTIDALVPIQYNNIISGKHEFGLLAHELQEIYPDLVNGEKDGDEYQHVHYNGLIGVLVKEVKELKKRFNSLP
jgi:hypothetical protein